MNMHTLFRRLVGLAVASTIGLIGFSVYLHAQDVMPVERRQWFDDNGVPLAGGLIYTYTAGTSTSAVTYTDSALTTQHANPVVLDSAGRATVYLGAASYRFIVATSAAVQLYTQDNIRSIAQAASQAAIVNTCDFRLSLSSGIPVTVTDVTAATTVYATPYVGNRCALYDGSGTWNIRNTAELSLSLGSDAANTNYDLFMYDDAGTPTLQRRAWTNNSTRATDLTTQDGVLVRLGSTTARYLGTYRTTGVAGQTEDTLRQRFVYNQIHQVERPVRREETSGSWTSTNTTFRQANANTLNAIGVVVGQVGGALSLGLYVNVEATTTGANVAVSIGEDSGIVPATGCGLGSIRASQAGFERQVGTSCAISVAVGYHTYQWLERVSSGTATWAGNFGGTPPFSWLYGLWSE